jgi:hypothetical protein
MLSENPQKNCMIRVDSKKLIKSDIFEIFCNTVEDRKNFLKHIFFNMGHQRPSNGEYIAGEKDFFGHSWSPGEPS